MADEEDKRTLKQKLLFYTTAFFVLLGTFSLFAFLFLVPFVIEPAFKTIFMEFDEEAALCVTMDVTHRRGASNCSWSSCREGCTRDMFECAQITVNYIKAGSVDVDEGVRRKRSVFEGSMLSLSQTYLTVFGKEHHIFERAIREDYDYLLDERPSFDDNDYILARDSNHTRVFGGAKLFLNVKGCGYPPFISCKNFTEAYGAIHTHYSCYYSRIDPKLVIKELDMRQVYLNLVLATAIPIPSFIISVIYLAVAYFVIYAEDMSQSREPQVVTGVTPVPPPTSGALTPNSEVFREDLASFGHDLKVKMADEASRESVATCTDAVPDSNSILDGNLKTLTTSITTPPGPIAAL